MPILGVMEAILEIVKLPGLFCVLMSDLMEFEGLSGFITFNRT